MLNEHFGSNNGDLEVHLIEHELGLLWSCMISVIFCIKYVNLDQIEWIMLLDVLLN